MQTIVFEVDNLADLVRLALDTTMSSFTTQELNAVKAAFNNTSPADPHFQLDIRLTRNFDLNYSDYWNKPEGSIFINMNRSVKTLTYSGGFDYSVTIYKCIDGGIYDSNNEVIGKHSITNIYLRKGSIFMNIPFAANQPINISPAMKNIDIEVVSNSGYIVYNIGNGGTSYFKDNRIFHNVCFNIKAYNLVNPLFYMRRAYSYAETGSGAPYGLIQFENCVFNIYIAVINNTDDTKNNIITVDTTSGASGIVNFYSCIFRIRNASNKVYSIVCDTKTNSAPMLVLKMDNCAVFLQDIGVGKPPYQDGDSPAQTFGKVCILRVNSNNININADCFKFVNSYIAAFGDILAAEKAQVLLVGYGIAYNGLTTYATNCSSSFYDKNKVKVLYWVGGSYPQEVDQVWLRALTTTECKDTNKLSEIGYIFCEET